MFCRISKALLLFVALSALLSGVLTGCSGKSASAQGQEMAMAALDGMPEQVKSAPMTVQQAYQFAAANPDTMKQFPCYCGCGKMGHTSNYSCYVKDVDNAGKITYDSHALGCSICVDITQDVMRLLKEKKSIPEIQAYIDKTYSQYGPSNMSPVSAPAGTGSQGTANTGNTPVCSADSESLSCDR